MILIDWVVEIVLVCFIFVQFDFSLAVVGI